MFDVLEHMPEPAEVLGRAKRLLRPGGLLAITLPNALRPLPWGRDALDYPPHHFTRWTPRALRGFLERQGFAIVRQDAGSLKLRFLAECFFYFRVMPPVLSLAKWALFGRSARTGPTMTELLADERRPRLPGIGGVLARPLLRQRAARALARVFALGFLPVGVVLRAYYKRREPDCGDWLYMIGRLTQSPGGAR
jgi:SAM-dependent methyltransferase